MFNILTDLSKSFTEIWLQFSKEKQQTRMEFYKNERKENIQYSVDGGSMELFEIALKLSQEILYHQQNEGFLFDNHNILVTLYTKIIILPSLQADNQHFFLQILDNLIYLFMSQTRISVDCSLFLPRAISDLIGKGLIFTPTDEFLVAVFQETLFPTHEFPEEKKKLNYALRMNELMQFVIDRYSECIPYQKVIDSFCEKAKTTDKCPYIQTLRKLIENPNVTLEMTLGIYDVLPRIFDDNDGLQTDFLQLSWTLVQKGIDFARVFSETIDLSRLFDELYAKPYQDEPQLWSLFLEICIFYLDSPSIFPHFFQMINHQRLFEHMCYLLDHNEDFYFVAEYIRQYCILYQKLLTNYKEIIEQFNTSLIDLFFRISPLNFKIKAESVKVLCLALCAGNTELLQYLLSHGIIEIVIDSLEVATDTPLLLHTIQTIIRYAQKFEDTRLMELIYQEDNIQIFRNVIDNSTDDDSIALLTDILDQNPFKED